MLEDLIFKLNSQFDSAIYQQETDSWIFYFNDNISVKPSEFWRLLQKKRIRVVSFDNGQQFGLPKPIDLVDNMAQLLSGKKLNEIKVDKGTGDLTLLISDNIEIQIFITSSGYETYEFTLENKTYIGLGSGDIGIVETTDNPNLLSTRKL